MDEALIIGNGPRIWDDLMAAPRWPAIVTDEGGLRHPASFDLWVCADPDDMAEYIDTRAAAGFDMAFTAYSQDFRTAPKSGVRIHRAPTSVTVPRVPAGSELLAALTAKALGYERIIFCGFTVRPHLKALWREHQKELRPIVRSMSGWSRAMFGEPEEWF